MTTSDNSYTINILNSTTLYLYTFGYPILYILGNLGNLLSALIFMKKSWKKNVCVFYFQFCLLYNTGYINSNVLRAVLQYTFNINLIDSSIVFCKLSAYALYIFFSLSPTVLICASVDRLLISSQNVDTRLYSSKRLAYFSISIGSAFWLIYYIHFPIQTYIQEIYPSYFDCFINLYPPYVNFVAYSSLIINSAACLTMIVLCIFAFKNVRRIRAIPREKRNQIRSMNKKDFQLLRCLFVQDIVYIIFSILITFFNVYRALTINQTQTELTKAIQDFLNDILLFLLNIPYCSNFFVFITVSKAFRHEFRRGIYKLIGKDLHPMREEENRQENPIGENVEVNVVSNIVLSA